MSGACWGFTAGVGLVASTGRGQEHCYSSRDAQDSPSANGYLPLRQQHWGWETLGVCLRKPRG